MAALTYRILRKYSSIAVENVRSSAVLGGLGFPPVPSGGPQAPGYGVPQAGRQPSEKSESALTGKTNRLDTANLDPEKFTWTIRQMCNILTHAVWSPEKEAALRALGQLTPTHTVEFLRKRCADPRHALLFFRWLGEQPGYEHDIASYNIMVSVLAESKLFSTAEEVYSDMQKIGLPLNTAASILIRTYSKAGMVEEALETFNKLKDLNVVPDRVVYTTVLEALMRAARYGEVVPIYEQMSHAGIVPDSINLQSLFNYYHHSEKPEEMYKVFEDLVKAGLIPKVEAQTNFIEGCCRTGKFKEAFTLYEEMVKDGRLPDPPTYLVLVDGLQKAGENEKVAFCAEKYGAIAGADAVPSLEKVSEDKSNISKLGPLAALGLGVESDASKAVRLKMQRFVSDISLILQQSTWGPEKEASLSTMASDIRPIHFIEVLKGGTAPATEAYEFFKWLKKQPRYKHNLATHNLMVSVLAEAHLFDPARRVLQEMHREGFQVKDAIPVIIYELGNAGMVDEAVELFNKLKNYRVEPCNSSYNSVISALIQAGRYDAATAMYQQLCDAGLVADVHNIRKLWEFYHNAEKPEEVFKFFEELCDKALIPWVTGYKVFIEGYSNAGRVKEACAFFDKMLASDCILEVKTYTVLKNALKAAGDEDQAKVYFDKMLGKGFKPNIL